MSKASACGRAMMLAWAWPADHPVVGTLSPAAKSRRASFGDTEAGSPGMAGPALSGVVLWDADRHPPALLIPGTTVRFVEAVR